ncbi:MAG: PepSY-associated TM helix domain-containing protein [Vicinamibacterales bacterium]
MCAMERLRTCVFWTHLALGVAAGAVILVMCVTGTALTYEKQLLEWADRRATTMSSPAGAPPLSPETLLAAVVTAVPGTAPIGLTLRADGAMPATVAVEGGRALLADPTSGRIVSEASPGLRRSFRVMTDWHRWLAFDGARRALGRSVTGVANLVFLFVVLSGLYLWIPRTPTWPLLRRTLWFRGGLPPKARHFNWHNVIGVWSALPLALLVTGALPISFGWAGDLVFRLAGEAPPVRGGTRPAAVAVGDRPGRGAALSTAGVDDAVAAAVALVPGWRTASVRLSALDQPLTVVVDAGYGGQPQYRTTFTIDRATARIVQRERFDDLSAGRRWRSWLRFVHTGEYYGLAGQTLAGLVSAGGAVLVYTGVALSLRRFGAWRRRRAGAAGFTAGARGIELS